MGGEQRQAETPAHLLLPGPDRDSALDASTVWGLTGQVGGTSQASWGAHAGLLGSALSLGAASSCGPVSVVWDFNRTLPRGAGEMWGLSSVLRGPPARSRVSR